MEDDLNTADALSTLFEFTRYANTVLDVDMDKETVQAALDTMQTMGDCLGLLYKEKEGIEDEEILKLIEEREEARKEKNYARADEIRDLLKEKGIQLKDTPTGVKFSRIES